MSDIYLSLTETPAVVTLSQPVVASSVAASVTVANVVSVNVVTMPAINVTAQGGLSDAELRASAVTVALDAASLAALESVTVTVGNVTIGSSVSISNFPAEQVVSVSNLPSTQTIAGTVTANLAGWDGGNQEIFRIGGYSVGAGNEARLALEVIGVDGNPLPISGTVTANAGTELGTTGNNYGFIALGVDDTGTSSPLSIDGEGNLRASVGTVTIGNPVTIGSVPNGSLTTRFGTPTTANVSFATSAVTNANRKYLLIQNVTTGSNVITVGIGFTPTTTQGIQLTAGAGITFESSYIPTGAVMILSSVTASNFTVLEA